MKKNKKEIKLSEKLTNNIISGKNLKSHNILDKLLHSKCEKRLTKVLTKYNKKSKKDK